MNNRSLPTTRVIRTRLVSLGTLANVFVFVLMIVILEEGGQYLFDMSVEFKAPLDFTSSVLVDCTLESTTILVIIFWNFTIF